MESFGVRRASESAVALAAALVLAAFSLPVAAQRAADDEPQLNQIQEILSRDGPYSFALLEPLTALGLLYQESEDYALAIVTLERALQIVRVNKGLHSLEQVPLVRQLIRSERARGNHAGAWERQQKLLKLARRHPDDIRTVPVLREFADMQMALLNDVVAGKRPPEVILGCYYKEWRTHGDGSCDSGSKATVIQGVLAEAQRNYLDAIAVMLRQSFYDSDDLRELELDVLRGVEWMRSSRGRAARPVPMAPTYLGPSGIEPWRSRLAAVVKLANWELPYPDAGLLDIDYGRHVVTKQVHIVDPYHRGLQSLRRLYAYGAASSASSLQQADAAVQMADWDLLYSHNRQAIASYVQVQTILEQAGAAAVSIELFAPPLPVVLPAFEPNPLARDDGRATTGYIDVAFEITKYGQPRAVEILEETNATAAAKRDVLALIRGSRFRPRLTDGEFADAAPVRVRYYLD